MSSSMKYQLHKYFAWLLRAGVNITVSFVLQRYLKILAGSYIPSSLIVFDVTLLSSDIERFQDFLDRTV